MEKYKVELAAPAASMYENLARLAAGEKNRDAKLAMFESLDKVIRETIPSSPFSAGIELCGPLKGLYWVPQDPMHVFYEIPAFKVETVSIVSILVGLPSAERKADAIVAEMVLSGRLRVLPRGWESRRAAVN